MSYSRRFFALLAIVLVVSVVPQLNADLATITVDIAAHTVSPENPTINIAGNDAVLLRIVRDGKAISTPVRTSLAGPRPLVKTQVRGVYNYAESHPYADGAAPLMVFRPCDAKARKEFRIAIQSSPGATENPECPFYTLEQSQRAWTIVVPEGVMLVQIESDLPATGAPGKAEKQEYAFAIQIVHR